MNQPKNKKIGSSVFGKGGTGLTGKSSDGKTRNPLDFGGKKSSSVPASSSSKSYSTPSYSTPKKDKSAFGIIWLPTKKRNKKKDMVFNSNHEVHPHQSKERSPSMYNFMSGDSSVQKTKEEEADLLVSERTKAPIAAVASVGTAMSATEPSGNNLENANPNEKQEFIKYDRTNSKDAVSDVSDKNNGEDADDKDYLENSDTSKSKSPENKWDKDKFGDKVDSVYLRPPPPHKARSSTTPNEDEGCGMKCLYYTLQCCDCVLM